MITGVAKLVVTYGDNLKDDLFKQKLGCISCKELSRTAKERKAGSLGYAEAMITYYNKKMHFGLSMSQLYGRKGKDEQNEDELYDRNNNDEQTTLEV